MIFLSFSDNIDVKPDLLLPKSEANSDNELFEDTDYDIDNDIKGDFKCLVCEKLFDTAIKLSSHGCAIKEQKENHQAQSPSSDSESVTPNYLPNCVKKLSNQNNSNNLRKRKMITKSLKTDNILHTCSECDVKFKSNHRLRIHMLKEHNVSRDAER